jgi:hypothetical protein
MYRPARFGPASATLLTIALLGCQAPAANAPTRAAATTDAPTIVPAPAASSAGPRSIPNEGTIAAGTYRLDRSLGATVDVPDGWSACCGGAIVKNDFAGLLYWNNAHGITVYADPCLWSSGGASNPDGAQAIADALAAQKNRLASKPREVTVGGVRAFVVRLTVPAEQPVTRGADGNNVFTGCDQGQFRSFTVGSDGERYHQAPGQIDDFYVLDVETTPVIFDLVSGPDIPPSDMAELEAMVGSVRFHPPE